MSPGKQGPDSVGPFSSRIRLYADMETLEGFGAERNDLMDLCVAVCIQTVGVKGRGRETLWR